MTTNGLKPTPGMLGPWTTFSCRDPLTTLRSCVFIVAFAFLNMPLPPPQLAWRIFRLLPLLPATSPTLATHCCPRTRPPPSPLLPLHTFTSLFSSLFPTLPGMVFSYFTCLLQQRQQQRDIGHFLLPYLFALIHFTFLLNFYTYGHGTCFHALVVAGDSYAFS